MSVREWSGWQARRERIDDASRPAKRAPIEARTRSAVVVVEERGLPEGAGDTTIRRVQHAFQDRMRRFWNDRRG